MNKIELRVANLDFTSNNEHELVVEGVVNDGNWSQVLGVRRKFKERIQKGAFTRAIARALQNNGRIDFLSEHDPNRVLSSTVNDSLTLWEDENKGLCMRAVICPTSWGKDTFQLIKSGIIKSMSFGFNVIEDEWLNTRSDVANRIVKDLHLIEVSAVRNPAYLSSAISARGMELVEDVEIGGEDNGVQEEQRQEEEVTPNIVEEVTQTVTEEVKTDVVEEVQTPAGVDNQSNDNQKIDEFMNRMLQQFEQILSSYIPKKTEVNEVQVEEDIKQDIQQVLEEPKKEEPIEAINDNNVNNDIPQTENVNVEPIVEKEEQKEEVVNKVNKSEIDYAIELLSKYKKIQELQR